MKTRLLNVIMMVLTKNEFGSSKSFSQSSRELLTINALVKPPKDIINDTIPNQSIIFLARLFFC
jgi:hypothetical protein